MPLSITIQRPESMPGGGCTTPRLHINPVLEITGPWRDRLIAAEEIGRLIAIGNCLAQQPIIGTIDLVIRPDGVSEGGALTAPDEDVYNEVEYARKRLLDIAELISDEYGKCLQACELHFHYDPDA